MRAGLVALLAALVVAAPVVQGLQIERVHPRARSGEATEFVQLSHGGEPVDLAGWRLDDGEGDVPLAGRVDQGGTVLVVQDPGAYANWSTPPPAVVPYGTTRFRLANGGDEIRLVDPGGRLRDAVAYGVAEALEGWEGTTVPRPSRGEVLVRRGQDTDTAADFSGFRRYKLGQSDHRIGWIEGANVTLYAAPDDSHRVTVRFLDTAHEDLDMNLYEFTHLGVADDLLDAVDRGVEVDLLLEGGPVGWNFTVDEPDRYLDPDRWRMWRATNRQSWIATRLQEKGADVHALGNARYRFTHAKYAVADGRSVLVTTENWGFTGLPQDPSFGNRGFGVVVDHPGVAAVLSEVHAGDADPDKPDVEPWPHEPHPRFTSGYGTPTGDYRGDVPVRRLEDVRVRPLVAPDQAEDLVDVIARADGTVRVMALDLNLDWGRTAPLRDALLEAAEAGAEVRVLVNDNPTYDAGQVQRIAAALGPHGIDVAGLRAGEPFVNLHAKTVVADDVVYVGSMNFNENAFKNNREVGMLVDDPRAARWLLDVFAADWERATSVDVVAAWWDPWGLVAVGLIAGVAIGLSARFRGT